MKIVASLCSRLLVLSLVWAIGPGAITTKAQAADALEDIGVRPLDPQLPIENGVVYSSNGNVHLEFLLGSFPQRHNHGTATFKLVYDSAIWTQLQCCAWFPIYSLFTYGTNARHFIPGWRFEVSESAGTATSSFGPVYTCRTDGVDEWDKFNNFQWTEPNGNVHMFNLTVYQGYVTQCGNFTSHTSSGSAFATDGSGYHLYAAGSYINSVFAPDGTQVYAIDTISPQYQNPKDTNGNFFSHNSNKDLVDSAGRTPVTQTVGSSTITYGVLNAQGGRSTYTVTLVPISISTNFSSAGSTYTEYSSSSFEGIQSIALPDGTSYSFGYDSGATAGHYGQLTSMTLPTGGHITYTYATFTDSMYLAASPHRHFTRGLTSRVTPDGSWSYTPQVLSFCTTTANSNCQQQLTVAAPSGDHTVFTTMISNNGAWPTKAQYYTGAISATNLLVTKNRTFNLPTSSVGAVTKVDDTITLSIPGGTVLNRTTQYCWDVTSLAKMTKKWEWNFYSGPALAPPTNCSPAATPDRTTTITYLSDTNPSYVTKDILDRALTVTVVDKIGNVVGKTVNCYDFAGGCGGSGFSLVSNVAEHDDSHYGTANTVRGDLTQVQRLISGTSNYAISTMSHDTTGQVTTATDANGNPSTFSYADNLFNDNGNATNPVAYTPPGPTNSLLKSVTKGGLTNTFGYYWGTGQKALATDPNNQTTYNHFYDSLNRATSTRYPDNGWNLSVYPTGSETQIDSATGITSTAMTTNCPSTSNSCRHDQVLTDSLGRVISQILVSDPDGQITTSTVYDSNGRVQKRSNPFRSTSDATYGWSTPTYDGLNRITQSLRQDGSISKTYFGAAVSAGAGAASQLCSPTTYGLGYPVLSVDEAGHKSQSWNDGFGRLIEADEPNSTNTLTLPTCYTYDSNSNLTNVLQNGSRQRTFTYDLLSRLLTASNPESGTITYTYDNNGNVLTKKDARNITTTYYYDALNRLGAKSYSDGTETLYYNYDVPPGWLSDSTNVVGRLANTSNSSGGSTDGKATAATYSYDAMGRIVREWEQTPSTSPGGSFVYQSYDLAGDLTSLSNGSGVAISYAYDSAARPKTVTSSWNDAQHPGTLYTVDPSIGYFPSGVIRKVTLPNGLTEVAMYNNRLQPCRIEINSTAAYFNLCTDAIPSGNVLDFTYGYNSGSSDNGNVVSWSSAGNQTFSRSYVYDSLNRISTLSDTAVMQSCKGLSWTIDPWGNRTDQTVTAGTCNTFHQATDANNRLVGSPYQYDAAGNMTHDASHSYTYDAENHLTQVDAGATASYIYDPSGMRVRKNSGGSWTEYFFDSSGSITAEHNPAGWPVEYVYVGGQLVAQYRDGTTYSIFKDHLGSTRLITKIDKSVYDSLDFLPFGEQIAGDTGTTHKFTGKERDSESGLDNFGARYDSSSLGRFMSPDNPKFSKKTDPQTWNLYSYVSNNPLARVDLTGENWFNFTGSWQWYPGADVTNDGKACKPGANGCNHSDFTHLLVVQKLNEKTDKGATKVKITLYDQNKVIAQGDGFTGGTNILSVPNGNYEINLNNRGGLDTNRLVSVQGGLVLGAFHDGIQQVGDSILYRGVLYDATGEWGTMRANLSRGEGDGTQYYLHGKGSYFTEGHSYTAGCVCDPYQGVLKVIFRLDPSGVGEGDKNGRIAVSVNKAN
jgi:RHS repeat-associated protein